MSIKSPTEAIKAILEVLLNIGPTIIVTVILFIPAVLVRTLIFRPIQLAWGWSGALEAKVLSRAKDKIKKAEA